LFQRDSCKNTQSVEQPYVAHVVSDKINFVAASFLCNNNSSKRYVMYDISIQNFV